MKIQNNSSKTEKTKSVAMSSSMSSVQTTAVFSPVDDSQGKTFEAELDLDSINTLKDFDSVIETISVQTSLDDVGSGHTASERDDFRPTKSTDCCELDGRRQCLSEE